MHPFIVIGVKPTIGPEQGHKAVEPVKLGRRRDLTFKHDNKRQDKVHLGMERQIQQPPSQLQLTDQKQVRLIN